MTEIRKHLNRRHFSSVFFLLLILFVLCGGLVFPAPAWAETARFTEIADFNGCTIASVTGTVFDQILNQYIDGLQYAYFDDNSSMLLALENGSVDALGLDEPVARLAAAENSAFVVFPQVVEASSYGLAMQKDSPLTAQVSRIIQGLAADGTLDALQEKWFSGDEDRMKVEQLTYDADNGVLRYAHDFMSRPLSYVDGSGASQGFEVELVMLIGQELGMKVEITQSKFASLINMLDSDMADITSGAMSITPERLQSVDFPTSHYQGGIVLLVRAADTAVGAAEEETVSVWQKLSDSFYKTFIKEARWQLILKGLGITTLIAVSAALCGTVLGFPLYLVRNCRWRWLQKLTAFFIRVIQSLPVVVFLMILYYLVFRGVHIDPVLVSIIAFSINFGVYVSEMLRSGIGAVPPGQAEASLAMGFSRWQTYTGVVLPQAARHILPVYQGEFISMLKSTSMVGYIAVQDLTKVGDIVRSNTFEALFPLIAIALLYFFIANVLVALLTLVEKKMDPQLRPRIIKGVTEL